MTMSEQITRALSPDTEAILLLCGRFGGERGERHGPLSQKEYEALTRWLLVRERRPSDLLGEASGALLAELIEARLDRTRVEFLLARGTALALAVEKWQRSGLWVLSRSDPDYPKRLKKKLGQSAPPLLYGAGDTSLLDKGGLAIVGSRDASEVALDFTRSVAGACTRERLGVVSGGAKGVDSAAMQGASEAGGTVVGVLASELLRASVNRQNRLGLQSGQLVLVSPFYPEAGFNAGNAMARNRYIYALADYALVVDAAAGEGGTWNGAVENLREGWVPLFVRIPGDRPGNAALVSKGALEFAFSPSSSQSIGEYLAEATRALVGDKADVVARADLFSQPGDTAAPAAEQSSPSYPSSASEPQATELGLRPMAETNATEVPVPQAPKEPQIVTLDMFTDFLAKLPRVLGDGPKTEEEIQKTLGLEKSQIKAWLKAAVEQGVIERHKKPVSYSLRRQASLY